MKQRLGFDYETLKSKNPRIILASISAFGQDGPYKDIPGVDQIVQGMSGLMSVTGEPGRGPMRVGIPIADIVTGLYAALGILTALMERQKSNQGQWVQASLIESQMFTLDLQAARYLVDGVVPKQVGNEHPSGVPTNTYRTKDGYVNIAPIPYMWPRLCKALGREDLIDHPDYATREARRSRRKEVNSLIQGIVGEMDTATLTKKMLDAEVPCGPINSIDQAFNDPQVQHLELVAEGRRQQRQGHFAAAPAVPLEPHAEQADGSHARICRAHRRGAGRVRLWPRGDQKRCANAARSSSGSSQPTARPRKASGCGNLT